VHRGKSAFVGILRLLKYIVRLDKAHRYGDTQNWVYQTGEDRKYEPLEPMKLYERPLKDDEPKPDEDDLVYERSLFTVFLQSFFKREDG